MPLTLKLLSLSDVIRQTGYSRTTIERKLGQDIADGTPGVRFPLPLRDPQGRPPGPGVPREWSAESLSEWIERRMR
jgi:hypothetical protein